MVAGCKATPGCVAYVGISYLTSRCRPASATPSWRTAKGNTCCPAPAPIAAEAASFTKQDAGQRDHLA